MVIKKSDVLYFDQFHSFRQLWVLLNTTRGSVPLQRDIGLDARMLDKPITVIRAGIQSELQRQLKKYIPQLKLINVECEVTESGLDIICEVELNERNNINR